MDKCRIIFTLPVRRKGLAAHTFPMITLPFLFYSRSLSLPLSSFPFSPFSLSLSISHSISLSLSLRHWELTLLPCHFKWAYRQLGEWAPELHIARGFITLALTFTQMGRQFSFVFIFLLLLPSEADSPQARGPGSTGAVSSTEVSQGSSETFPHLMEQLPQRFELQLGGLSLAGDGRIKRTCHSRLTVQGPGKLRAVFQWRSSIPMTFQFCPLFSIFPQSCLGWKRGPND